MGTVTGLRRYLSIMLAEIKEKGCKDYGIDQVSSLIAGCGITKGFRWFLCHDAGA